MEKQNIINSGMGIVILGLLIAAGISLDSDNIYYGTDGQEVTCQPRICESLSKVNSNGLQTRCYYFDELENRTRYKNCGEGWIPYESLNVTGTPINDTGIWVDVEFEIDKLTALKNKGITYPELTPCIKIDNFTCEARIYEKGGINKPLVVTYIFFLIRYIRIYTFNQLY